MLILGVLQIATIAQTIGWCWLFSNYAQILDHYDNDDCYIVGHDAA